MGSGSLPPAGSRQEPLVQSSGAEPPETERPFVFELVVEVQNESNFAYFCSVRRHVTEPVTNTGSGAVMCMAGQITQAAIFLNPGDDGLWDEPNGEIIGRLRLVPQIDLFIFDGCHPVHTIAAHV